MRMILIAGAAMAASACVVTGSVPGGDVDGVLQPPQAAAPVSALPAQSLQPGQCGLFLFGVRPPNPFVVFEDEDARTVQIVHGGSRYTLPVTGQSAPFVSGEAFGRRYIAAEDSLTFTLEGRVGEETRSGTRLEDVILTVAQPDGTRTVRPLGGVRNCREG